MKHRPIHRYGVALGCALILSVVSQFSVMATAHAGRCRRAFHTPRAPVAITIGPANFGAASTVCAYSSFALDAGGVIDLQLSDFYGAVAAEVHVSGSYALSDNVWFAGSFNALRAGFVQNASIVTQFASTGQSTLSVHGVLGRSDRTQSAVYARVLLPTSSLSQYSLSTGIELGFSGMFVPAPWITITGNASVPLELHWLGASALARPQFAASSDIALTLWQLELVAGIEARLGLDRAGALEFIAPRAAIRAHFSSRTSLAVNGLLPLAGVEKTTVRATLTLNTVF